MPGSTLMYFHIKKNLDFCCIKKIMKEPIKPPIETNNKRSILLSKVFKSEVLLRICEDSSF